MERPPPDPRALLTAWMEWEKGEATPGRVMANLKTAGMRDLLDNLVAAQEEAARTAAITGEPAGGGPLGAGAG